MNNTVLTATHGSTSCILKVSDATKQCIQTDLQFMKYLGRDIDFIVKDLEKSGYTVVISKEE